MGHINIIGRRQVVIVGRTQETVAVGHHFQHADARQDTIKVILLFLRLLRLVVIVLIVCVLFLVVIVLILIVIVLVDGLFIGNLLVGGRLYDGLHGRQKFLFGGGERKHLIEHGFGIRMAEYDALGFFLRGGFLAGRLGFRFLLLRCPFCYGFDAEMFLLDKLPVIGFPALFCRRIVFNGGTGSRFFCRAVSSIRYGNGILARTTSFLPYFGRLTIPYFFLFLVFFNLYSG
ncbi:hypothetical protein Barb4_04750 [Bacteroidales bacterium Barb4]|nr:hypothetical protein Barb4_04750 [Bacteroidales bacterium Barb4]